MRVIREVGPIDDNDFEITTNDSLAGTFDGFTALLYGLGFVVGFITLAGAGIGVMNIMLVSVTERTREIGVRKSVGQQKSYNQSIFDGSCIYLPAWRTYWNATWSVRGNMVAVWIDTEMVIPMEWVFGSFFGMLAIGLLFGVYPAYKAAQLDPIESLRYE